MVRVPRFSTVSPGRSEVSSVLWNARATAVSYLLEPRDGRTANAWLYVCSDQSYALEKLPHAMRKNVRRGMQELRLSWMLLDEVLAHGAPAFCDTRGRNGLTDGTLENFHQRFGSWGSVPGHVFVGAWHGDRLAAFLSIMEVDDWAEIEGTFAVNDLRHTRPNDLLYFAVLQFYLARRRCRTVSAGTSSVQLEGNAEGLHTFKEKAGFEAYPVNRVVVLHPLLRPLANRFTLLGLEAALRLKPGDRRLRKASGLLAGLLGQYPTTVTSSDPTRTS